jgi:hypothetical protein
MWGLGARELGYRDIVSDDCCKKMTFHSLKTLSNGEKFRDVLPENWHVSWYKLIYIYIFFSYALCPTPMDFHELLRPWLNFLQGACQAMLKDCQDSVLDIPISSRLCLQCMIKYDQSKNDSHRFQKH